MEKVKVMCAYCGAVVEVDKSVADKLNETTVFCCNKCIRR
uniref:TRASH domain-containing protein n=1 Tax=viral metagenome TaxID=1070528 RepID=A0A6M3Y3W3_9ZZZZ